MKELKKSINHNFTEQFTGEYWEDKKVYTKDIDIGVLPNATTKEVSTGISNIARIRKCAGISRQGAVYSFPLPYVAGTAAGNISIYYRYTDNTIVIATSVDRSAHSGIVTIEYTKTTD